METHLTFSSSSSTALAISFFCSKTASNSNLGTVALMTFTQKIEVSLISKKHKKKLDVVEGKIGHTKINDEE